jgi:alkanesulfonate monooxygenase
MPVKLQAVQRSSQSEALRRMTELHNGRTDSLEICPNLRA